MQHILVPTDFSSYAQNALDYAAELARRFNSTLTLYHACQIPTSGIHRPAPSIIEQEKQTILKEARRKLKLLCRETGDSGIACFMEVTVSPVVDGILEVARETGAGMIVMGTRGSSGLSRWLLGSTTSEVIQNSLIPVLAIPDKTSYRHIERIIFATDYRDSDFEFIKKLVDLASRFESELGLLHVQTEQGEFRSSALFESFREKIRSMFDYRNISFHLLENDNVIEAINRFTKVYEADIISMATSRKNLFDRVIRRSKTREMAYITEIPLLAFNS